MNQAFSPARLRRRLRLLSAYARRGADRNRTRRWFLVLGIPPLVACAAVLALILRLRGELPALDNLDRIQPSLVTRLYDVEGRLVEEFYTQRRVYLPLDSFPRPLVQAVLAVEDRDFFRHWGVDLSAIPGAALSGLGGRMRGASTLTQQLAKNLFLTPERSIARKVKEVMVALRIERTYTKAQILEMYLNQVYLGGGAYGFKAAAERYYSRALDSLGVADHALLAGLLRSPEGLRPDRNLEASLERRNLVLGAMRACGYLEERQWEAAVASRPALKPRDARGLMHAPYFCEAVRLDLEQRWGKALLDSAGLDVRTTLDLDVQAVVDTVLRRELERLQEPFRRRAARALDMASHLDVKESVLLREWDRWYARFDSLYLLPDSAGRKFPRSRHYRPLQAAVVVLDNATGGVRALTGGGDFARSSFNRAVQAVRSPGSVFKPIVYAAAVDMGEGPGTLVDDHPIAIPDPGDPSRIWEPSNIENDFEGVMSFRRALYRSRNIPAIIVAQETGLDTVAAYARRFGLSREIKPLPSLGVGALDATLLEMASAYTVFPNLGLLRPAHLVDEVSDRSGGLLFRHQGIDRRVLKEQTAWVLCDMLRDVNVKGTAAPVWAGGFRHPSGGKTGTTNDYRDAWYIGFTRRYTAGVWVGFDDFEPMGPGHTGSDAALPIWLGIMRALHKGLPREEFPRPDGLSEVGFCALTGKVARSFCDSVYVDWHIAGSVPVDTCVRQAHGFWRFFPGADKVRSFFRRIFGGSSGEEATGEEEGR